MALKDEVKARYGNQLLVNLTNPSSTAPTAIDETRLDKAVEDVLADFENEAGLEFDEADPRHVAPGVEGVIAKLRRATGLEDSAHGEYLDRLHALRDTSSRARLAPETPSEVIPDQRRPQPAEFSDRFFEGYVPGARSRDDRGFRSND